MITFVLFVFLNEQIIPQGTYPTEQECMAALTKLGVTGGCAMGRKQ